MSARATPEALRLDPGNMLFGRFTMRRLTAEEIRDSILAVSGQLELEIGGPERLSEDFGRSARTASRFPGNGWTIEKGGGYDAKNPTAGNRRSVYAHVKRSLQVPILIQHDQADADSSCPVRYTTTVPTQALGLLNGEFTNTAAAAMASRLEREYTDLPSRVRQAIRLTTGRSRATRKCERT